MGTSNTRYVKFTIVYGRVDVSGKVRDYLRSASYTDAASGDSDKVSFDMEDRDRKWLGSWKPIKGDRMALTIRTYNWTGEGDVYEFYCGNFLIDDLSGSGPPRRLSIGGVAVPQDNNFRAQKKTHTWAATSLQTIAADIAALAGVNLVFDAADIQIDSIEQSGETDCAFLASLCEAYGYAMKVHSEKLVIYDVEAYEQKASIKTIQCEEGNREVMDYRFNDTIMGSYTGANFSFQDPNNDEEYSIHIGSDERLLEINVTADNLADAERKGIAALNLANREMTVMTVTTMADPGLAASCCVDITGLNDYDGKYFVDKVVHRASGGGNYTMELTLHRVIPWIKTVSINAVEAAAAEESESIQYTVKSGDTLWDIAKQYLGSGVQYVQIYNDNASVIEAEAKKRGKTSSENGHWIFPGTVLTINRTVN